MIHGIDTIETVKSDILILAVFCERTQSGSKRGKEYMGERRGETIARREGLESVKCPRRQWMERERERERALIFL